MTATIIPWVAIGLKIAVVWASLLVVALFGYLIYNQRSFFFYTLALICLFPITVPRAIYELFATGRIDWWDDYFKKDK